MKDVHVKHVTSNSPHFLVIFIICNNNRKSFICFINLGAYYIFISQLTSSTGYVRSIRQINFYRGGLQLLSHVTITHTTHRHD